MGRSIRKGDMITVVHCKRDSYDFYIGRGSILGNPYTHLPLNKTKALFQVKTREEAISEWEKYAWEKMQTDAQFRNALLACENKTVGCYCYPLSCHGNTFDSLISRWKNWKG